MDGEIRVADLVVDVANVMGSRPDGWWRDRAGAAERLVRALARLPGTTVALPEGTVIRIGRILAVVEGRARGIPDVTGVDVVRAPADGDTTIVRACDGLPEAIVVTADRGLRDRLPPGASSIGPRWLLEILAKVTG